MRRGPSGRQGPAFAEGAGDQGIDPQPVEGVADGIAVADAAGETVPAEAVGQGGQRAARL